MGSAHGQVQDGGGVSESTKLTTLCRESRQPITAQYLTTRQTRSDSTTVHQGTLSSALTDSLSLSQFSHLTLSVHRDVA